LVHKQVCHVSELFGFPNAKGLKWSRQVRVLESSRGYNVISCKSNLNLIIKLIVSLFPMT